MNTMPWSGRSASRWTVLINLRSEESIGEVPFLGAIDSLLRAELERALAVADRANNADVHERDGRWMVQGRSDGRRAPRSSA